MNEKLVIGIHARKGGVGKTTLVRVLASALIDKGKRVLALDTDPQKSLVEWGKRVADPSGRLSVRAVRETAELASLIDDALEADSFDFVIIDTPGVGGDWADYVAAQSDILVVPVMLSETDLITARHTMEWFTNLAERVDEPELLPPMRTILTRVPTRTTRLHEQLIERASIEFPMIETVLMERNQFMEMDGGMLLGELARKKGASTNPLLRSHARYYREALDEADEILGQLWEVARGKA